MNEAVPRFINRKDFTYVRLPKPRRLGERQNISIDVDIQGGEPCIAGTRIPCASIYGYYKAGDSIQVILNCFPYITREEVIACINYMEGYPKEEITLAPN